jgi:hypothetical protein
MRRHIIIWRVVIIILYTGITQFLYSQSSFNVYNSWNFENETLGTYTDSEIAQDFNYTVLNSHNSASIVNDVINNTSTKVMRITHPANRVADGFEMNVNLSKDYNEIYLSFNWKFSNEFNSTQGGKLPGLGGLPDFGGYCPVSGDGFRAHNMFYQGGGLLSYHYDRTDYGYSDCPWALGIYYFNPIYFSNGTWYNITQRLVMNTFTNGVANGDGIKELWVDGRLIFQETNLKFMEDESETMKIDAFRLANFYGGDAEAYWPLYECYGYINNIKVYMPVDDPVTGHALHSGTQIIHTPDEISDKRVYYDSLLNTVGTLSNSEYGNTYSPCIDEAYLIDAGADNKVTFAWDYSLGSGDYLFIYDGNTTDSELMRVYCGPSAETNRTIASSGRYLFIRFSTDRFTGGAGWRGTISFSNLPSAPSNLIINSIASSSINLSWQDNSAIENGFEIERSDGTAGNFHQIATTSANVTTYADNLLQPQTSYYYRVRSFNSHGHSAYSNITMGTTSPIGNEPNPPSSLRITEIYCDSLELQWFNNSLDVSGIEIERSDSIPDNFNLIATLNPNSIFWMDRTVSEDSRYFYRLRAYNSHGYSIYSQVIDTITPPSTPRILLEAPTNLKFTSRTQKELSISWEDNSDNENSFLINRGIGPGFILSPYVKVPKNVTTFTDYNLPENTKYNYSVVAYFDEHSRSDPSNTIDVSTESASENKRVKNGLVAYYNFTLGQESSIINDYSAYGTPLDLKIESANSVEWTENNIFSIIEDAKVKSVSYAQKIISACKNSSEITVECWINTGAYAHELPANIISLEGISGTGFTLQCQNDVDENNLVFSLNLTTESTSNTGTPSIEIAKSCEAGLLQHIVFTRNVEGRVSFYSNGNIVDEDLRPLSFNNWSNDLSLFIGNDYYGNFPWHGKMYLLSIYNRALTSDEVKTNYFASPFSDPGFILNSDQYHLVISPNPSSEVISIKLENPNQKTEITEKYYLRLINQSGLIVEEILFVGDLTREEALINTSGVPSGLYSLILFNNHQLIDNQKLIVKH